MCLPKKRTVLAQSGHVRDRGHLPLRRPEDSPAWTITSTGSWTRQRTWELGGVRTARSVETVAGCPSYAGDGREREKHGMLVAEM